MNNINGVIHIVVNKSNKMQKLRFCSSQWLTLHVSGDNLTHHQEYISCIWPPVSGSIVGKWFYRCGIVGNPCLGDYLQLHNDRTTLLLTNLQPK